MADGDCTGFTLNNAVTLRLPYGFSAHEINRKRLKSLCVAVQGWRLCFWLPHLRFFTNALVSASNILS